MSDHGQGRTHRYESTLVWTGAGEKGTASYAGYGRDYTVRVEGKPELVGSANRIFRGDPTRHDPEDLFLAALSGCHLLTYLAMCARQGVRVLAYEDRPWGVLELDRDGGGRFAEVELRPRVTIAHDSDAARAGSLHEAAHRACFIAASVSVPVRCRPAIDVATAPATGV